MNNINIKKAIGAGGIAAKIKKVVNLLLHLRLQVF
jgi:hypothetical protein